MQVNKNLVIVVVVGLILSEITLQLTPKLGFLLYAFLVAGVLIALGFADTLKSDEKIIISFMILPMIRIVEIFLTFSLFWRTLIVYLALLFLVFFYIYKFRVNVGYTTRSIRWLPFVFILGIAIGLLGNWLFGLEKHRELFYLIPLIAFSEEFLFRGLIQREIASSYSNAEAIFASSIMCFAFTISYTLPIALFFFFASLISAYMYNKTGNIWLSIGFVMFLNMFIFVV